MSVPHLPSSIPRPLLVVVYYLLAIGAAVIAAAVVCEVCEMIGKM